LDPAISSIVPSWGRFASSPERDDTTAKRPMPISSSDIRLIAKPIRKRRSVAAVLDSVMREGYQIEVFGELTVNTPGSGVVDARNGPGAD
jgi:hypothetical protein